MKDADAPTWKAEKPLYITTSCGRQPGRKSGAEMRREYQTEYRGKYVNGKIVLLQKTDLEEGEEVFVYPDLVRYRKRKTRAFGETSGGGQKGASSEELVQTSNEEQVGE